MAILAGISTLPGAVQARGQAGKVTLFSESPVKNSQTMALLEGFTNINPTGTGGAQIAIVDDSALSYQGTDDGVFVDEGISGGGQISVYIVRKGDTLASIAKMFGVSTNTILWANDIKGGTVKEGQELVILPISGVRHTVKSGDTLISIAKKYKADLAEVMEYNSFPADKKLSVGEVVIVPDGTVSLTASGSVKPSTSGTTAVQSGYYMRPTKGVRSQGVHGHNGIDIAAPTGTTVWASAPGKVIVARGSGYNGGYGAYIVVSHANGTQTLYAHLSRVNVSVGQSVTKGQAIGAIGNTGKSTGPHLHFEVRGAKNPF